MLPASGDGGAHTFPRTRISLRSATSASRDTAGDSGDSRSRITSGRFKSHFTRSRSVTIPTTLPPEAIGMRRTWCRAMSSRARSGGSLGLAVRSFRRGATAEIAIRSTGWLRRPAPAESARSTSRSVRMPTVFPPRRTRAAPMSRRAIAATAFPRTSSASTETSFVVIRDRSVSSGAIASGMGRGLYEFGHLRPPVAEDRTSVCSYCGCGCRLTFKLEGQKVLRIAPDRADPASQGSPCVKGLTLHEVADRNRVLHPMARDAKGAPLREVSWEEAFERIHEATHRLAPEELFLNASGKVTNEDCYVTGKFARVAWETSNIDACCTRLCHVATVEALRDCFGNGATPHKMDDVAACDVILIVGSNPASNYPVLFHRLLDAKKRGMRIASVQVLVNTTAQYADIALLIRPATEI